MINQLDYPKLGGAVYIMVVLCDFHMWILKTLQRIESYQQGGILYLPEGSANFGGCVMDFYFISMEDVIILFVLIGSALIISLIMC